MKTLIAVLLLIQVAMYSPIAEQNCHCFATHDPGCRCVGHVENIALVDRPPVPGDVITYEDSDGMINHSARYVGNGWVQSKMGSLPKLVHPMECSFGYGSTLRVWEKE